MNYILTITNDLQIPVLIKALELDIALSNGKLSHISKILEIENIIKEVPDDLAHGNIYTVEDRKIFLKSTCSYWERYLQDFPKKNSDRAKKILNDLKEIEQDQIIFSVDDCNLIIYALEVYCRLFMGQIDMVLDHFNQLETDYYLELKDGMMTCEKFITGLISNAYWGISSPHLNFESKIGWEIYEVIRHRISWDRKPEGGITVNFREPMNWTSEKHLKIEKNSPTNS